MSDVYEHNPSDHEDPTAGPTWIVGGLGVILLAATLFGVTALYYNVKTAEVEEYFVEPERSDVMELRKQQEAMLEGPPRHVTRDEAGTEVEAFVIPIDRAMELVVQEYGP